jgi:hypothetical protein
MQRGLKKNLFSEEDLELEAGTREVAAPLLREALKKLNS